MLRNVNQYPAPRPWWAMPGWLHLLLSSQLGQAAGCLRFKSGDNLPYKMIFAAAAYQASPLGTRRLVGAELSELATDTSFSAT